MEVQIANDELVVTASLKGAEIRSVKKGNTEYLWQGDPAYREESSPLLFPYVGRLTDGKYRYKGMEYRIYLCIEPWTSLPSRQDVVEDLEFKHDLIRLKKQAVFTSCWQITIQ